MSQYRAVSFKSLPPASSLPHELRPVTNTIHFFRSPWTGPEEQIALSKELPLSTPRPSTPFSARCALHTEYRFLVFLRERTGVRPTQNITIQLSGNSNRFRVSPVSNAVFIQYYYSSLRISVAYVKTDPYHRRLPFPRGP